MNPISVASLLILSLVYPLHAEDPKEVFINVDNSYFKSHEKLHFASGSNLTLECASSVQGSQSPISYKWYITNQPYSSDTANRKEVSTKRVYSVTAQAAHSGYYMCFINTTEGYAVFTPAIHVIVEYFDVETKVLKKTIEPYTKVSVLACSTISANPTPNVRWLKDGVGIDILNLERNIMKVTGKVLDKIYNIKVNDLIILNYDDKYTGVYSCETEAKGTLFKGRKKVAYSYTVQTAASTNPMQDNTTNILFIDDGGRPNIGDAITLRCGASGYPTPSYVWQDVSNNALQTSDRFKVYQTKLIVKSVQGTDDDAEYKCRAESGDNGQTEPVRIQLSVQSPEFNSTMANSEYNIPGANVTVNLALKSTRSSASTTLLWNGRDLGNFGDRGELTYNQTSNTLTILNIKKNASGVFQGVIYNEAGMQTQFKTVVIRDAQPAAVAHTTKSNVDITVKGNTIHSVRGANFTMECEGSGNPTPKDITIDVPDQSNAKNFLEKVNQDGKYIGRLLIDSVTESYAGSYNCCTYNFVNGQRYDACVGITLAVEEKVQVTQNSPDEDYSLVIGSQVYGTKGYPLTAECKATGLPRPSINITRPNQCGTVSTITKSNDLEFIDNAIIRVQYAKDTGCITDSFKCCGKNEIQGIEYDDCYSVTISFVEQQKPNSVLIENNGAIASDTGLISVNSNLDLNCSAKSFPEAEFSWVYKKSDADSTKWTTPDYTVFQVTTTKSKGFTFSRLMTIGLAGDHLSSVDGEKYDFRCTAKNIFGEATQIKTFQINQNTSNQVSSSVYLGIGIFLFFLALIIILVMYIFFLISSGKKNKSELGCMECVVCQCCEPKPEPSEGKDSVYAEKIYQMKKVDLYPEMKQITFDDDEFDRTNTVIFNPSSEFVEDRMFTMNTAAFKDPDIV